VDLFDWEEQDSEINLSGSGMEPIENIDTLNWVEGDPKELIAEIYGVNPDNILLTHGAQEAMFLVLAAFRLDVVDVLIPTYPPIVEQAQILGARVNFIESPFESKNRFILLVNPNNPTGEYIPIQELIGRGIVVVDEIFKPFISKSFEYIPGSIILMSTSKFFSVKDHKVGWIISDKKFIRRIKNMRDLVSPPPIGDKWLINFIVGSMEEFYRRNLSIIKENYSRLSNLDEFFHIIYNHNMPIAVLFRDELEDKAFAGKLLKEKGVLLTPTSYFYMPSGLRISLGHSNHQLVEEAVERMNELIRVLK